LHKDVVVKFRKSHGIYLGNILAGTKFEDFMETKTQFSRAKQYLLEQYLREVDQGWIFRKAHHYWGAFQADDEEKWGLQFLTWLLARDSFVVEHFYLCRELTRCIPHSFDVSHLTRIRVLAKSVADQLPAFMDIRVKIHGQPGPEDIVSVRNFRLQNKLPDGPEVEALLRELEEKLVAEYRDPGFQQLGSFVGTLPGNLSLVAMLSRFVKDAVKLDNGASCDALAELLLAVREAISVTPSGTSRLLLMDLSLQLEAILSRLGGKWTPKTLTALLQKSHALAKGATGCGFVEIWEWESAQDLLQPPDKVAVLSLTNLARRADVMRRCVYAGTGMVRATFGTTMNLFSRFEPIASGFADERVRASIMLPFGDAADEVANEVAHYAMISNSVLGISNQNEIRGLNPGFAMGTLTVLKDIPEGLVFSPENIYFIQYPPTEMTPVAGIATVNDGNLVSHVQLLARNLGIPNALLSQRNLAALVPYSGKKVFYGVSPRGRVVLKLASVMTPREKMLVEVKKRSEERIRIPTEKIDLSRIDFVSLLELRAKDSGRICGPKAANLGELRQMFPQRVAPGFVIPFGAFRTAMDLPMTGTKETYWNFLVETFSQASEKRVLGQSELDIEGETLARLARLRESIRNLTLPAELVAKLRTRFLEVFGSELGKVPVFIRSDTNMEDVKDFTGAGLNLTVPNVVTETDILRSLCEVWASPFGERSYQWRQKYLLNPEMVYPSVLVLKSVNVEKSGVMITAGVMNREPRDTTVAFNRGVGGAVDGQAAETFLLLHDGSDQLLAAARESGFKYLPPNGGVEKGFTSFDKPILGLPERQQLRLLSDELKQRLPGTPGIETNGPFDVELGFIGNSIWLFQVRPFSESKKALSTSYLQDMDPPIPADLIISMEYEHSR
jgi:hypothetical protein